MAIFNFLGSESNGKYHGTVCCTLSENTHQRHLSLSLVLRTYIFSLNLVSKYLVSSVSVWDVSRLIYCHE